MEHNILAPPTSLQHVALRTAIQQQLSQMHSNAMLNATMAHPHVVGEMIEAQNVVKTHMKWILDIKNSLADNVNRKIGAISYLELMGSLRFYESDTGSLALLLGQMLPDAPSYILGALFPPMEYMLQHAGDINEADKGRTPEDVCSELYGELRKYGGVPVDWAGFYRYIIKKLCIEQLLVGAGLSCIQTVGKLVVTPPGGDGIWTETRIERFSDTSQLNQSFILAEYSMKLSKGLWNDPSPLIILNQIAIDVMTLGLIYDAERMDILFDYLLMIKNVLPESNTCDPFRDAISLLLLTVIEAELSRTEADGLIFRLYHTYADSLCKGPVESLKDMKASKYGNDVYNRLQNFFYKYDPVLSPGAVIHLPPSNSSGLAQEHPVGGTTKPVRTYHGPERSPKRRKSKSKGRRRKSKSKGRRRKSKSKSRRRKSKSKSRRRKSKSKSRRRKSKSKSRRRKSKSKSRRRKSKSKSRRRKSKSKSRRRKSKSKSRRRKSKSKSRRRKSKSRRRKI